MRAAAPVQVKKENTTSFFYIISILMLQMCPVGYSPGVMVCHDTGPVLKAYIFDSSAEATDARHQQYNRNGVFFCSESPKEGFAHGKVI